MTRLRTALLSCRFRGTFQDKTTGGRPKGPTHNGLSRSSRDDTARHPVRSQIEPLETTTKGSLAQVQRQVGWPTDSYPPGHARTLLITPSTAKSVRALIPGCKCVRHGC